MNKEKAREYIVTSNTNHNNTYTVRFDGFRWFCSCKSFQYNCHQENELKARDNTANHRHRRFCKHILNIKNNK